MPGEHTLHPIYPTLDVPLLPLGWSKSQSSSQAHQRQNSEAENARPESPGSVSHSHFC